jgi:branched-chain amino acid transport system permease protein
LSNGTLFYVFNLLIYAGVDILACLGISQQLGIAGVSNLGFIIFQAAGAYTAAILSLPSSSSNGAFQDYIGGWNLPFPLPWIGAAVVGGLVALPFTFLVGRRLRGDFAAVGLLVAAVMLNLLVTNYKPLFNGDAGLSLVPAPIQGKFDPQSVGYQGVYAVGTLVLAGLTYLFLHRITESPYGRTLRAMRDNDVVADSLGKNLRALRAAMLVLGGAIAGLSGAILIGFISLWAPSAWGYAETVVLFAAVIIGGSGNHKGAILGAILVPLGFEEATRFIPPVESQPGLIPALQWVAIGLLIVTFLWFRPQGILPERRRVIGEFDKGSALPDASTTGQTSEDWTPFVASAPPSATAGTPAAGASMRVRTPAVPVGDVILQTVDLTRTFEGVPAVAGVSISIRAGRLTGLIGPNGAGKSTMLSMLAGTLEASSGQILYRGQDITTQPAFRRARTGLVRTFQLASEFKRLTVLENLLSAVPEQPGDSFVGAVRGRRFWQASENEAILRAETMLDRFGLRQYGNHYAGDLSGGQRRLVEIMRALMTEPEVLLLDEPMAGIHPRLARQIGRQLVELCGEGMTIVMVEHELALMDEFCDPVIVLAEGRVLAEGTMAALRARAEVVEAYLVG